MKKILLMCLVALLGIGTADAQKPKKGGKVLTTTEFITNIDCEGCAKKVYDTMPVEKGVRDVKVDVPSKVITITFDPTKTNHENIIKAFAKLKIEASVLEKECKDGCCDKKPETKGECKDGCCDKKPETKGECKDGCCDKKPETKGECKDGCCDKKQEESCNGECEGHDHGHHHDHKHGHKH